MNTVLAGELLKMRKRWMPYVLLLVMVSGAAVLIWLIGYVGYHDDPSGEFSGQAFRTFAFPWSLAAILDSGQFWGAAIFVTILTASTVATEYNWGTVRQVLIRGQGRAQFLAVKLLGTALVCTAGLLVAFAAAVALSVLATVAAGEPITLDVPDGPSVPDVGLMIVRSAAGILPYGLLAFALTVLGRSTALGVGGTIGYMLAEGIVGSVFKEIGGSAADVRDVLIGHNVSSLVAANRIGPGDYNSIAARELPSPAEAPDVAIAVLVIAVYCLALLAVAFAAFLRRDIRVSA